MNTLARWFSATANRSLLCVSFLGAVLVVFGASGCKSLKKRLGFRGTPHTLTAWVDLPAGQANGSSDPQCPPAKCGDVVVNGIPTTAYDVRAYGQDLISGPEYECKKQPPNDSDASADWWDCGPNWARYEHLNTTYDGGGNYTVTMHFKNWRSQGQRGTVRITYYQ